MSDHSETIKKIKREKCKELNDLLNINQNIRNLIKEAINISNEFKESDNESIKSMIPFFEKMKNISDRQKKNLTLHGLMHAPDMNEPHISSEELTEFLKENKDMTVEELFQKKYGKDFKVQNPAYIIPLNE